MKVYLGGDGMRLVGRAEVPEDHGAVYEVPMSGDAAAVAERFIIAAVPRPTGATPPRPSSAPCWHGRDSWWNCCRGGSR